MKSYSHAPANPSRTFDPPGGSIFRQPPLREILQTYGKNFPGRRPIQRLSNRAFQEGINGLNPAGLPESDSLGWAEHSVRQARGPAYIVHTIVSYKGLDELPQVIVSICEGLGEEYRGRIAILIGVNAPEKEREAMEAKIRAYERPINAYRFLVVLVPITFGATLFPYGQVRNALLTSEESGLMTRYFLEQGYHPYISVQDFDTGSRRVGSEKGKHIFKAVDELLMPPDESMEEEEMEEGSDDELLMPSDESTKEEEGEMEKEKRLGTAPRLLILVKENDMLNRQKACPIQRPYQTTISPRRAAKPPNGARSRLTAATKFRSRIK